MKMKHFFSLFFALVFTLTSCSSTQHVNINRVIANDPDATLTVDDLLTFKRSTLINKEKSYLKSIEYTFTSTSIYVEFVKDDTLKDDVAYKIVPTIENQKHKLKILFAPDAIFDEKASEELARYYSHLNNGFLTTSDFAIFELYYNAKAGDFTAQEVLSKLRYNSLGQSILPMDLTERQELWGNVVARFEKQERAHNKKIKEQSDSRKLVMDTLDKATNDKQFRNLVAKNDRKGAAALLKSYLPWEKMPPFEKLFWENHLNIMSNPLPLAERVLVFRGIDGDIVQTPEIDGKKLTRTEAMQEQKMFLMSTMMSENQGTWNRRLRSLNSMYDKFMGTNTSGSNEYTKGFRISNMFKKHSIEPKGSPFLSFTPDFTVAKKFGYKTNAAYFIDPRALYFNFASNFKLEYEVLLPLVSFPEDLAAIYDVEIHPEVHEGESEQLLRKLAIENLEKKLGAGKGEEMYTHIAKNSNNYFPKTLGINTYNLNPVKAIQIADIYNDFQKILTQQIPDPEERKLVFDSSIGESIREYEAEDALALAKEVAEADKNKAACKDIIQLFWK